MIGHENYEVRALLLYSPSEASANKLIRVAIVDTSVFTTFYVGVLTNAERVKSRCETPHFEILFRVSYGCSRDELEVYNENIRLGRWRNKPFDKDDVLKRVSHKERAKNLTDQKSIGKRLIGLSWTYSLQRGMTPPSVLFEKPMCVEVMGAGFQKLPASEARILLSLLMMTECSYLTCPRSFTNYGGQGSKKSTNLVNASGRKLFLRFL